MRKAIVTMAGPRMAAALDCALPTFARFAGAHGYILEEHRFTSIDEDGPTGRQRVRWYKIDLLRRALEGSDLVVWLDADTLIRRFDRDIANELPSACFQALTRERFPNRDNPNTGVWVLRGGPAARSFLETVTCIGQLGHSWADQAAVCRALGWHLGDYHGRGARPLGRSRYLAGTAWLPGEWNAVRERPDARIRHFAGMGMSERLAVMQAERRCRATSAAAG